MTVTARSAATWQSCYEIATGDVARAMMDKDTRRRQTVISTKAVLRRVEKSLSPSDVRVRAKDKRSARSASREILRLRTGSE